MYLLLLDKVGMPAKPIMFTESVKQMIDFCKTSLGGNYYAYKFEWLDDLYCYKPYKEEMYWFDGENFKNDEERKLSTQ